LYLYRYIYKCIKVCAASHLYVFTHTNIYTHIYLHNETHVNIYAYIYSQWKSISTCIYIHNTYVMHTHACINMNICIDLNILGGRLEVCAATFCMYKFEYIFLHVYIWILIGGRLEVCAETFSSHSMYSHTSGISGYGSQRT